MKDKEFNVTFGVRIRARRDELALTQRVVAEKAKLSPNYVARLERGELCPSLVVAHALCRALGTSIDQILKAA